MTFRLLDTGILPADENMALDQVLLEGVEEGWSPPTLRFMQFDPPAVLVGGYQRVEDEVRQDWCREHAIHVNRRITGGGTIFFDRSQLGWEVVCGREHLGGAGPSAVLFEKLCTPVIETLREMGIPAEFRPRNDIEVHGRKISGTGGTSLGDAILFQGTLLTDFDAQTMVRALRIPVEKLRKHEMDSFIVRVTWIGRELEAPPTLEEIKSALARRFAEMLGVRLEPGGLKDRELDGLRTALPRFRSSEWIHHQGRRPTAHVRALYPTPGGMLRPLIACDEKRRRIQSLVLDGDFFSFPARGVLDLEAALKGAHVRAIPSIVHDLFSQGRIRIPDAGEEHVVAAITEALDRREVRAMGLSTAQANSTFAVCCRIQDLPHLRPTHLLLPYCAKSLDCEYRHEDRCDTCGECAIGDSYELGTAHDLTVHTITSFEHLMDTLSDLARQSVPAWLGSCCEPFYIKHRQEMESFDLPGILFDVASNVTCYDLGKGSLAYAGEFEGLSEMDLELLGVLLGAMDREQT